MLCTFTRAVFDSSIAAIAVATAVVADTTGRSITVATASVATVIVVTATDEASTHVGTLQTCYVLLQGRYLMQL